MNIKFKFSARICGIYNLIIAHLLILSNLTGIGESAVVFSHCGISDSIISPDKNQMDISQARLMLKYLDLAYDIQPDTTFLDTIMQAKGTELIIQQMNLARRVSHAQYRKLLAGFYINNLPILQPMDSTERSRMGIDGLVNNVWPVLKWGRQNTALLRQRLDELKELNVYNSALKIAAKFLPRDVNIAPWIYIVMGGRAGFAALSDNYIYFDLLVMTFSRIRKGAPQVSPDEIMEYFAHEMHHLGLRRILAEKKNTLNLNLQEKWIFSVLSSLVSEGSATYLINGHRTIKSIRENPGYSDHFKEMKNLLMNCESILISIINGEIKTEREFEDATSSFIGHSYHAAGSQILSIIDQAGGLESIMSILNDPRKLLSVYNDSVKHIKQEADSTYLFNDDLAKIVADIGD